MGGWDGVGSGSRLGDELVYACVGGLGLGRGVCRVHRVAVDVARALFVGTKIDGRQIEGRVRLCGTVGGGGAVGHRAERSVGVVGVWLFAHGFI